MSAPEPFQIGAVVVLLSGSPPMTVQGAPSNIDGTLWQACAWFDGGTLHMASLPVAVLRPAVPVSIPGFRRTP